MVLPLAIRMVTTGIFLPERSAGELIFPLETAQETMMKMTRSYQTLL